MITCCSRVAVRVWDRHGVQFAIVIMVVTVARRLVFRKHCKQKVYSIMSELFVLPSFSRFLLDAPFHRTSIITSRTCIPKLTSGS